MAKARIQGRVDMDASSVGTALGKASSQASAFAAKMKGIGRGLAGAFSVGAITAGLKGIVNNADEIQDTAESLAMTTDELQAFQAISRTAKGGAEGMETSMKKLIETQAAAVSGSKSQIEAFERLNITGDDLTLSTAELVKKIADGYVATRDFNAVQTLLGRSAVANTAFLESLSKTGVEGLISSMTEAGQVIDQSVIAKLAEASDRVDTFGNRAKVAFSSVVGFGDKVGGVIGAMMEGRSFSEAKKFVAEDESEKNRLIQEEAQKAKDERRNALRGLVSAGSNQDQIAALEKAASAPMARASGSDLVRIGARGGLAGVEDKAVKLAREQLAAMKQVASNTEDIDKIATGVFTPP